MKKILTIVFLLAIVIGCRSYTVVVSNDEFTNATNVKLDIWHRVVEGQLDNTRILYERNIKDGKASHAIAKLEFQILISPVTGYGGENLDPYAYLLIGSKNYKIRLLDNKKTTQEVVHGGGSTNAMGQYEASVSSYHTAYLRAKILFTPEMEKAMLNANIYKIRVSTDGDTTTMEADKAQLAKVKEFFAVKGPVSTVK